MHPRNNFRPSRLMPHRIHGNFCRLTWVFPSHISETPQCRESGMGTASAMHLFFFVRLGGPSMHRSNSNNHSIAGCLSIVSVSTAYPHFSRPCHDVCGLCLHASESWIIWGYSVVSHTHFSLALSCSASMTSSSYRILCPPLPWALFWLCITLTRAVVLHSWASCSMLHVLHIRITNNPWKLVRLMTCASSAHDSIMACSWWAHDRFMTVSRHVHDMSMTDSSCVHDSPHCRLSHVHDMFMTCSWHAHDRFITC